MADGASSPIVVVPYADYGPPRSVPYYYRFRPDATGISAPTSEPSTTPSWPQCRTVAVPRVPLVAVGLYQRSAGDTSQSGPTITDAFSNDMRVVPYADAGFPRAARNLLWSQDASTGGGTSENEIPQRWQAQQFRSAWIRPNFYGLFGSADDASAAAEPEQPQNSWVIGYDTFWYDVPPTMRLFGRAFDETAEQQAETGQSTRFIYHVGKLTVARWLLFGGANDTETDAPQQFAAETPVNFRPVHRAAKLGHYRGLYESHNTDPDFPTQVEVNVNMRVQYVATRHRVHPMLRFVPAVDFAAGATTTAKRRRHPWRRRMEQLHVR